MLELACVEMCDACGLSRAILFSADGCVLQVRHMHWTKDEDLREEWSAIARKRPPTLDPRDRETQLLRRHVSVLVTPDLTHGMREVVEASQTAGYVAAPLIVNGTVIATLHGDRQFSGEPVDTMVRDLLATFAEGVGALLERTALLEQVRLQSRRMRALLAEADTAIDGLTSSGFELLPGDPGEANFPPRPSGTSVKSDSRLVELLTRRELEVMELMARGATNTEIATRLVISQTTVKSHVKHILRKLHAVNRAQATSRYVRLQSKSTPGED
jgi:DNA-binding CsgD family transcriptional regulator